MRLRRLKIPVLVVVALSSFWVFSLPARADLTVAPASPQVGYCTFFGFGSLLDPFDPGNPGMTQPWGPYGALVYRNLPAFDLAVGDILAFDLGAVNEVPPAVDIAMAVGMDPVSNNYSDPAAPFTHIVSNTQTPTSSGNTVIGDYEIEYTVEQPYSFPGGTLFIRISNPTAAYQADNTCTQVNVYGDLGDANDFFVRRYLGSSTDYPWTGALSFNNGVTAFRIINDPQIIADLGVSISGPPSVLIDTDYSYTVEYINNGPEDATAVEVVIATPADIIFDSVTPPGANCTADSTFGATVTCAIGDLANGAGGTITVNVTSPMTALDRTEATATIDGGPEEDDDAGNDSDTAVVFVNALEIEIEDSRFPNFDRNIDFLPAKPGDTDPQTFTVRNDSPNPVGITVFDAPAAPFMLTDPNNCEANGVAGGNTCTFNVAFMPTAVGSYSDSVILDFTPGGQTEITLSGNGVPAMADLSLSKTANVTSVTPGAPGSGGNLATYTLTVENLGPDDAEAVVTDMLPSGVTVNGTPPMNYDPGTGVWDVGTVAFSDMVGADNTVSLDIPVLVGAGVPVCLTNSATVAIVPSSNTEDPNAANDSAELNLAAHRSASTSCWLHCFDESNR